MYIILTVVMPYSDRVQILCESDEYYIVQSGDDYGLSNYDHIALTGKGVHEGDVIS